MHPVRDSEGIRHVAFFPLAWQYGSDLSARAPPYLTALLEDEQNLPRQALQHLLLAITQRATRDSQVASPADPGGSCGRDLRPPAKPDSLSRRPHDCGALGVSPRGGTRPARADSAPRGTAGMVYGAWRPIRRAFRQRREKNPPGPLGVDHRDAHGTCTAAPTHALGRNLSERWGILAPELFEPQARWIDMQETLNPREDSRRLRLHRCRSTAWLPT